MALDLSVVIPVYNESPNLEELHRELTETLGAWGRSYEVLFVDDGSRDDSYEILARLQARRPARPGGPIPAQLRPDGGLLGRVRLRPRAGHRHVGRRSAERSARHPGAGREAGRGLRHRLRLAARSEGQVADAPRAVDHRQPADLERDRRRPARLRLLAEGVPGRGGEAAAALRRDAPLHPGDRQRAGRQGHRDGGEPPAADGRHVEVRPVAHDPRDPRPADGQVPAEVRDAAAADLRPGRPVDGRRSARW